MRCAVHRIGAAILVTAAVLALNAGMLRDAFAAAPPQRPQPPRIETMKPVDTRSAKVLSLLLILESLRQSRLTIDG